MTRTKTLSAVFAAVLVVLAGGAAITLAANSGVSGTNAAMQDETTTVGVNETTAVDANETTVGVTETTAVAGETTAQDEETTDGAELQSFNVSGLNAPNTAAIGETITVSANVTNPNEQEDTQPVEFRLDGVVVDRQEVTLGANETQNVTFDVDTTDVAPGLHIHGVLSEDFGQLDQITLLDEPMTTTPGDNVTTTPGDNVTTTEVVNETTTEGVETTEPVETTEDVINETTEPGVETTTEEPVVETTTEEPVVETTTEAPQERVEQLVFKVEQLEIDEWSFIVGDSETPDRTEVIEGVDIRDRTQRINLTQLMMEDGSIEDAMGNETGDDYETITTPSEEDRELPTDLETVRVVIRDVTIENVTFIVEVPSEAELPEMPETITPEEPEETTAVVDTETEEPVETTTAIVDETTTEVIEETTVAVNETTAAVNETTEVIEETPGEEGTETTEDDVEETTTAEVEGQSFEVDNLTAPETATIGDTIMVSANVTNPGDEEATQRVEFRIDGNLIDRQQVTLGPDETQNVTFEADTTGAEPGIYVHGVLTDQFGVLGLLTLQEGADGVEDTTVEETTVEEETATEVETVTEVETATEEETVTEVETETEEGTATDEETTTEVAAAAEAEVTFEDQESNGSAVVVDSVTMSEGGFVTIHNESLLEGDALGSVVGTSEYLEAGTHENVTVELNQTLDESQTLIAMPHLDTNENQQYDFVESGGADDGPYLSDEGGAVTDSGEVTLSAADETTDDEGVGTEEFDETETEETTTTEEV